MGQVITHHNIAVNVRKQGKKGKYNLLLVRFKAGLGWQYTFFFSDKTITTADGSDQGFWLFVQDIEIVNDKIVYVLRANTMLADKPGEGKIFRANEPAPSDTDVAEVSDELQRFIENTFND